MTRTVEHIYSLVSATTPALIDTHLILPPPTEVVGRGFASGAGGAVRRAGVRVGVLLAGSALAYGGSQLFKREERLSLLPNLLAASAMHQPSVRETRGCSMMQ